ncbi:hypothetical protein CHU92_04595 [Flavobacterium cyanobacteriorum]|uniref:DNA-binding response regulator n=1 Tax=Flavobacterium cyanobacteriorum TaxID=2022802 RepID=A0A255ZFH8_9FLAO|nr:response regulator transcription factor [Flavobacterium cyanobacteriorum]OYQ39654.1 hypothetical protein CHU92_04595 [Flavobacterium cyanobacteriorum]
MVPKVLIVEDELVIALDIQETLEAEGYESVMNISSVEEAIEYLEHHTIDLVIIDINLKKDKDGVSLGMYLLEKDQIPFIYLTSYSDKATLERVKESRPYGYIVKPFKTQDLVTTVSIVLNNFKHRKIDVARQSGVALDSEIPFILKKCITYIHDNIDEKIVLEDLITLTRWGKQYFIKVFKEYLGYTPTQYIIKRKIEKATSLIVESDMPITQISYELGFKSHSNFSSHFKRETGKSPENYRKWMSVKNKYL